MPRCSIIPERAGCACRSQCASLVACQIPLKSGLPSVVRPVGAGACAGLDARLRAGEGEAIETAANEMAPRRKGKSSKVCRSSARVSKGAKAYQTLGLRSMSKVERRERGDKSLLPRLVIQR